MDRVERIVYKCTGINEHGEPCLKTLYIYRPPVIEPIPGAGMKYPDLGAIEKKCRRCKTVNVFELGDYNTAIRGLQKH